MNRRIFSKSIDRDTMRGVLFFIKDEDDDRQIEKFGAAELYRQASLCYLTFYELVDSKLRTEKVDDVIKDHITYFHKEYDGDIQELYKSEDANHVPSIIQMVEAFIKETITARYEHIEQG